MSPRCGRLASWISPAAFYTTRRHVLPLALVVLTLSLATPAASDDQAIPGEPNVPHPNVLFVAIDDLNDWTGFLGGHPQARTPNLDRLASQGVVFERAYCAAPACNPSRAALLTGIRPSSSGVYHNNQPWRPALRDAVTLPQAFRTAGYRVVGMGKIFHGRFNDRTSWHEYVSTPGSPEPPNRPANGIPRAAHFDWGPVAEPDEAMGDYQIVSRAADFLAQPHDRPFFLAVGMIRPHLPWYVPEKYFEPFPVDSVELPRVWEDDLADVPPAGVKIARPEGDHRKVLEHDQWHQAVQGYLASIAFTDAMIGRLIEALRNSHHAENTIIVLWGDHGWHLGEKQHWRKFALWEEANRVPLVIVAPGLTRAGTRTGATVSLLDLYPTLLDLCGLPARAELEGDSLVPLLKDPGATWDRPALMTHGRGNHAVRSERWRYIRYADGSEELYDHQNDPMEWTNLAGSNQPEPRAAREALARWLPQRDAPDAPREAGGARGRANRDAED